jgi:hypothetical protein
LVGNNTAYVYERNASDWNLVARLRPTDEIIANVLVFGHTVSVIPGDHTVIVGDYLEPSAPTAEKKDAGMQVTMATTNGKKEFCIFSKEAKIQEL